MSKYSINGTTLDNIAAPIMSMRGLTGGLTPEEMGTNANTVLVNVTDALNTIAAKGVDISGMNSDNLAALIAAVPQIPQSAAQRVQAYITEKIPSLRREESEEIVALRQMIEALRGEVESAGLKDADKASLLARLDEMYTRLDDGYADIAALQEIRDAMDGMQQTVKELTPRDTYMAAMIEYESLRFLGEAIYDQNMDVVVMILDSIGRQLHEDPQIPNYGKPGKGPRLQKGMTLAIEPMICEGDWEVDVLLDDWTAVTVDGGLAAHYENTVVITDGEPELLTL